MQKLLTIKQLSELIQVSPKTIYNWTHIKYIPYIKFRKGVRFNENAVMEWLRKKRMKGRNTYKIHI